MPKDQVALSREGDVPLGGRETGQIGDMSKELGASGRFGEQRRKCEVARSLSPAPLQARVSTMGLYSSGPVGTGCKWLHSLI